MLFERYISIARMSPTQASNDKEAYAVIATGIPFNLQPASAALTAMADGVYGQTYQGFTTYSGFAIGDQVSISGTTRKLIVKSLSDWNYQPIPHYELILFEGDQ